MWKAFIFVFFKSENNQETLKANEKKDVATEISNLQKISVLNRNIHEYYNVKADPIGKGSFGSVHLAQNKKSKREVACKVLLSDNLLSKTSLCCKFRILTQCRKYPHSKASVN